MTGDVDRGILDDVLGDVDGYCQTCYDCGNRTSIVSRFCPRCGTALRADDVDRQPNAQVVDPDGSVWRTTAQQEADGGLDR